MRDLRGFELLNEIEAKQRELGALQRALVMQRPALPVVGSLTLLKCRIGNDAVALRVDQLQEVLAMAAVTPLPAAPVWICGTLRIGNEPWVLLDLLALDRGERRQLRPQQFIALWARQYGSIGLVLDELMAFETVAPERVLRPSDETPFAPHAVGLADLAEGPFLLLDPQPLAAEAAVQEAARG